MVLDGDGEMQWVKTPEVKMYLEFLPSNVKPLGNTHMHVDTWLFFKSSYFISCFAILLKGDSILVLSRLF